MRYRAALRPAGRATDSRFAHRQQVIAGTALSAATFTEKRSGDAVTGGNAEFTRGPGDDLEHSPYRAARGDQIVGHRLGILRDTHDASVAGDENHVERNIGIVHPELDRLLLLEIEQHAAALGQLLAEHQAHGALGSIGSKLNRKGMHAGARDDIYGILAARGYRQHASQQGPDGYQQRSRERRPAV